MVDVATPGTTDGGVLYYVDHNSKNPFSFFAEFWVRVSSGPSFSGILGGPSIEAFLGGEGVLARGLC